MINKRRSSVFETNSSSTHSLALTHADRDPYSGDLKVTFGEYGWSPDVLIYPTEKLSYILTSFCNLLDEENKLAALKDSEFYTILSEEIKKFTGGEVVVEAIHGFYSYGYIDHQSADLLSEYFYPISREKIIELVDIIFNDSEIYIDNDNN